MELYVTGRSAIRIWKSLSAGVANAGQLFTMPEEHTPKLSRPEANALAEEFDLVLPINVAVKKAKNRRNSSRLACTCYGASSDKYQYLQVREGLYIARPEACLMQLATTCSTVDLAFLASELCACYSIEADEIHKREPVCTKQGIVEYLAECHNAHGQAGLERIIPYILEGSISPMQSVLALMLCLPVRWGGYGFAMPQLNSSIEVPALSIDAEMYNCSPDLLWPARKLVVQYEGARWGTDWERSVSAQRMHNDLVAAGYTVLEMSDDQLLSTGVMDGLAAYIARILRKSAPALDEAAVALRRELRQELLVVSRL